MDDQEHVPRCDQAEGIDQAGHHQTYGKTDCVRSSCMLSAQLSEAMSVSKILHKPSERSQ